MNELSLELIKMIITQGPYITISILQTLSTSHPTLEQIENLKINPPSHYFGPSNDS
jgi:hypothetical protein